MHHNDVIKCSLFFSFNNDTHRLITSCNVFSDFRLNNSHLPNVQFLFTILCFTKTADNKQSFIYRKNNIVIYRNCMIVL